MVTSDFRPEVEIRPFHACAIASCHNYWKSSFIMDLAMGQIPRSTERISTNSNNSSSKSHFLVSLVLGLRSI